MVIEAYFDGDMKSFLTSKEFTEFPLYQPKIIINLRIIPDNVFNEQRTEKHTFEGSQSFDGGNGEIKLTNLGKVKVLPKTVFTFDIIIPSSYVNNRTKKHEDNVFNGLVPTVGHELTHAYQTYRQMLGGQERVGFGKEGVLNALTQAEELKFDDLPTWGHFLHTLYLSLSFEVNARVTELYYDIQRKGVKTKDEVLKIMLDSDPWGDYKRLKDFDSDKFIRDFDNDLPDDDPMANLIAMLDGRKPRPQILTDDVLRQLIKGWDNLIQNAQKWAKEQGIDTPFMEEVPQSAKENPRLFFKFFEKRFHKKAEGLKRKLGKVVSLVVQENQEIEKK
jgi:hypothetical protein